MADQTAIESVPTPVYEEQSLAIPTKSTSKRLLGQRVYAEKGRAIRTNEITFDMVAEFLNQYSKTGLMEESAARVGLHKRHIQELARKDDEFKAILHDAEAVWKDTVLKEATRRALDGWDKPVFNPRTGEQVGSERLYDSNLMILFLKRHHPEFNEKLVSEVNVTGGIVVVPSNNLSADDWAKGANTPITVEPMIEGEVVESKKLEGPKE